MLDQLINRKWISEGFETLVNHEIKDSPQFDVVIIGSGYGGAIAASELAETKKSNGQPLRICVLERGNEYLPGMFPANIAELPGHIRFNRPHRQAEGVNDGLFDIRINSDVSTLLANGLGGGSLINAGVMEIPRDEIFNHDWPSELQGGKLLKPYYERALHLVGAKDRTGKNTIERHAQHQQQPLQKFTALKSISSKEAPFRPAMLSVAMTDKLSSTGVPLQQCNLCGDCATGCNHSAKESLDTNLLAKAKSLGVEIYTGVSVLKLIKGKNQDWLLETVYTDPALQQRHGKPIHINTNKVIMAAGALGSTEILQRSQTSQLKFSHYLGERFSSNGDMIAVGYNHNVTVNAIAQEQQQPSTRNIGPTITGIINTEDKDALGNKKPNIIYQEMAVPGALAHFFEQLYYTALSLESLTEADNSHHQYGELELDPFSINQQAFQHSTVIAAMGDDGATGTLHCQGPEAPEGSIAISAKSIRQYPLFRRQIQKLQCLFDASLIKGKVLANPVWQRIPTALGKLIGTDNDSGPLLTVHPLGGCPMADDVHHGVVNHLGMAFDAGDHHEFHHGLVVLDGSIVPTALAINPALSITAIALRAVEALKSEQYWNLSDVRNSPSNMIATDRPITRNIDVETAAKDTEIEVIERLNGEIELINSSGNNQKMVAELTLNFASKPIQEIIGKNRYFSLKPQASSKHPESKLRLFTVEDWQRLNQTYHPPDQHETYYDKTAKLIAPLTGTLAFFTQERSTARQRRKKALYAWSFNRGMRDSYQSLVKKLTFKSKNKVRFLKYLPIYWRYLSKAGAVRLLEYDLTVGKPVKITCDQLSSIFIENTHYDHAIKGIKRFTYNRYANPWIQLMEITLTQFPGLNKNSECAQKLCLDPAFLTKQDLPLIRITKQENSITALKDLTALTAYFVRALLTTHLFSFRLPDMPKPREAKRLPTKIDGLPEPEVHRLVVGEIPKDYQQFKKGDKVAIQLTRYPKHDSDKQPLVMIHGYSTSGTTFAHHSINPNFANYFWTSGRDVWILDLRTSSGLSTAKYPWTIEDVAITDIPKALSFIHFKTRKTVDVFAHCLGSVMFSMAILSSNKDIVDIYPHQLISESKLNLIRRKNLPSLINKAVLSQMNPGVIFTPGNVFRAYILNYCKNFLPLGAYDFNARSDDSNFLLVERLLSTLPYPSNELPIENPKNPFKRTEFSSIRHRIDILYNRAFNLENIADITLDYIDDLFGPMHFETILQSIYFSNSNFLTNQNGINNFVSPQKIIDNWIFPTMLFNAQDSGLVDVASADRMQKLFAEAGINIKTKIFPNMGHQDSLIGKKAIEVMKELEVFLSQNNQSQFTKSGSSTQLYPSIPKYGPVIGRSYKNEKGLNIPTMCGISISSPIPEYIVILPIKFCNQFITDCHNQPYCIDTIKQNLIIPKTTNTDHTHWLKTIIEVPDKLKDYHQFLIVFLHDTQAGQDSLNIETEACARSETVKDYISQAVAKFLEDLPSNIEDAIIHCHWNNQDDNQLCFAIGSCQYPANIVDKIPAYQSYQRLANRLEDKPSTNKHPTNKPELLLLLGDQVYTDPTAGLFDPSSTYDRYSRCYFDLYGQPEVRRVLRQLPSYMMPDDHEFKDNLEPICPESPGYREHIKQKHEGLKSYKNFQQQPASNENNQSTKLWHSFEHKGFNFFMLDSRTNRKPRSAANMYEAHIKTIALAPFHAESNFRRHWLFF